MKRTFVLLQLLTAVSYEDETAEEKARWLSNLTCSGVADGYTYAGVEDYTREDFDCNELEFADESIQVYNFMGSANEEERFYVRDIVVFKHTGTGNYYVLDRDDLEEF